MFYFSENIFLEEQSVSQIFAVCNLIVVFVSCMCYSNKVNAIVVKRYNIIFIPNFIESNSNSAGIPTVILIGFSGVFHRH